MATEAEQIAAANRELYAKARRQAVAIQGRRQPRDPQTAYSPGRPPVVRRTLCICGDFGPCLCAEGSIGRAKPAPKLYELERAIGFYLRHPPASLTPHQYARPSGVCTACETHFLDATGPCEGQP
jgi:hypothetical protein